MFTIESEFDELASRVDKVNDSIGVLSVAGSKDANLILFSDLGEAFADVRPKIDACDNSFFLMDIVS